MSQIFFKKANPVDHLDRISILHETCNILIQEPELLEDFYFIMLECSAAEDLSDYIIRKLSDTTESQISQYFWVLISYLGDMLKGYDDGNIRADTAQLKGKVVELYLFKFLTKKYDCAECWVKMRHHVGIDDWESAKEIDVLGWDYSNSTGEFYECKFCLSNTETEEIQSQLSNLQDIKNRIRFAANSNCIVGFVTFQDSESAKDYLSIISGEIYSSDLYAVLGRDMFT